MTLLIAAALFALGVVVASFIGVVAARLYTGEGFLAGRSRCDACGAPLPPAALIPVVSYLALRGRSRCCGVRLSAADPVAELVLGALFALAYAKLGLSPALALMLVSLALLLALVRYDFAHQILPPPVLAAFVLAAALAGYLAAPSGYAFLSVLLTASLLALSLALIHAISRGRAMGLADAPLTLGLGLLAGPVALTGFVFSFWIGAAIGILLLARRPRGSRMNSEVPFAPFLAAGFLLAYFTQWNLFAFAAVWPR
ncbi:MAG TPA: prepilin peptidase [Candidatus Paceibacterota bacterium]|nr:prepilin peptidase [Candidatus Paceibacterota bacterium]